MGCGLAPALRRSAGFSLRARRTLSALAVALVVVGAGTAGCRGRPSAEDSEKFVEKWRVLYNSHDLPGFTQLYADQGIFMPPGTIYPVKSRQALRPVLDGLWRRSPSPRISAVHQVVASADRIAFVWELTYDARPGGAPQKKYGATFLTLADGRVTYEFTVNQR